MSLRKASVAATALAAFGLLITLPGAASAAEGDFLYNYTDQSTGQQLTGLLPDPDSAECVALPEAADPSRPAADTPVNATDSTVVMFAGTECDGQYYVLRPGGQATSRLKLRSVMFS